MSSHDTLGVAHDHPHGDPHDDNHEDHNNDGPASSLRDYLIGFVLSVILTAIPFWLVMSGTITDRSLGALVLGALAAVQMVVHMLYFLHMNGRIQAGWTMLTTIFTVVFVAIAVAGTLWVMFNMNINMMPSHGGMPGS